MAPRSHAADVQIVPDTEALALFAAELVTAAAESGVAARGSFRFALAGGSTPRRLYQRLADPAAGFRARFPWAQTQIFFGDERFVSADHVDSNFRMAREALLERVPISPTSVFRVRTELGDANAAAEEYEARLRAALGHEGGARPRFDLVLLGLGIDGHTASLFPGSVAVATTDRLVVGAWVEQLQSHRVTFTLPLINDARSVLFLVAGADKAEILRRVLSPTPTDDSLPARRVRPQAGRLTWLVDAAAAAALEE